MKRLRVILLFLMLGALASITMAWSLALFHNNFYDPASRSRGKDYRSSIHGDFWIYTHHDFFGTTQLFCTPAVASIHEYQDIKRPYKTPPRWSIMNDPPIPFFKEETSAPDSVDYWTWKVFSTIETSRGWPFRMLSRTQSSINPNRNIRDDGGILIRVDSKIPAKRLSLPLQIYWRGFAFNTIFYATFLWLLLPGPFVLRRFIRHKRGLCVKCAYDLREVDHQACPECGEEIRRANPA